MKTFNLATKFELIEKPEWFDDFRMKYDSPIDENMAKKWPNEYHMTLKVWTQIDKDKISELKNSFKEISNSFSKLEVDFNGLVINQSETKRGYAVMIPIQENKILDKFFKKIREKAEEFGQALPEFSQRDKNFKLHITIGRRIQEKDLEKVRKEIKDTKCRGLISNIVLYIGGKPNENMIVEAEEEIIFDLK